MRLSNHGGSCCGIKHIHGFGNSDDAVLRQIKRSLTRTPGGKRVKWDGETLFEERSGTNPEGKIIEVVLTDGQIRSHPRTCAWLKKFGFKLVHRFDNRTGSMCNVLHYCHSTQPNESSPWQSVPEYQEEPEKEDNAERVPQVGEVWRINGNTIPSHGYNKNQYVVVIHPSSNNNVPIVRPLYRKVGQDPSQYINLNDISFIRSQA